ncbi:hypothetical protein TWF481_001963 [Arthrobotrys musiformis]|uniref:Uncharacterized protein n=1 Tax=Arthrobotrys musiformis TaxID=47236 RepID=A0AAV9VWW4_9PEZI
MSSKQQEELPSVPVGEKGLELISLEREVFNRYLLTRPGERGYEEREAARALGRIGLVRHIQGVIRNFCQEHRVPEEKVDRIIDYLCTETVFWDCFVAIDEERAFGRPLNLEARNLDGCDAICILFGIQNGTINAHLKSHVSEWVATMWPTGAVPQPALVERSRAR